MNAARSYVIVGQIVGILGVRGWLKIQSYTHPRDNLLNYRPWFIVENNFYHERQVLTAQAHGKGIGVLLDGCHDPDSARPLVGLKVSVLRTVFPQLADDEYYWTDLINLNVVNLQGIVLGAVDHIIETGANDVLVIKGARERYIPYLIDQVIHKIDLINGIILVDWDAEL